MTLTSSDRDDISDNQPIPALEAELLLGAGLSLSAFLIPGREFRYGSAYVSLLLGHGKNYFARSLSQGTKTPSKKLKALRRKGFTGYQISVKAPRKHGGATIADTLGFDDFSIWVEYEAVEEKNPKAIALLTSSFREVLLGRTREAFGLAEISQEEKLENFALSFDEREVLWNEDREELAALHLPGDEDGYELVDGLALTLNPLLERYGIDPIAAYL